MDLKFGDEWKAKFITNVGLITSYGKDGDNVMAAEWTYLVSYSPGLIAVCIRPKRKTYENIKKTKEFGVNLAATDQNVLSSVSGGSSGNGFDKIKALEELGFSFFRGKSTKALIVEGSTMSAECKLVKTIKLGDHVMFVGEIVELYPPTDKTSMIYSHGKYFSLGDQIKKPEKSEVDKINVIVKKHARKSKHKEFF